MKKIAITTTSFGKYDQKPLQMLEDFEIVRNTYGRVLKENELVSLCGDSSGIIAGTEKYSASVLEKLSRLRVISRCGTGIDNIDMDAAKRLNIQIFNTPDAPIMAVAELTIALILNLIRKISSMDRDIRNGLWKKNMGNLLCGKKVGIIGYGKIGRKVAELLKLFRCEIAFADLIIGCEEEGCRCLSLNDLLEWSDIVTIHVSSNQEIIGYKELERIKKGSYLLNLSRGHVINQNALLGSIKDEHLAGAALDVFPEEPYNGPLKELENVILTPHIGSYAKECRVEMEVQAAGNVLEGLESGRIRS